MLLFVYGTLMRGMRNHALMDGCKFIDRAMTLGTLYHLGGFPGFRHPIDEIGVEGLSGDDAKKYYAVYGEVWEVPELKVPQFDRFEGVPHLYTRDVVRVYTMDDIELQANIYVYATDPSEYAQPIEGGQWKE